MKVKTLKWTYLVEPESDLSPIGFKFSSDWYKGGFSNFKSLIKFVLKEEYLIVLSRTDVQLSIYCIDSEGVVKKSMSYKEALRIYKLGLL